MDFRPNPLLYGAHEGFCSSFKLVVTMRDDVEHALLQKAVASAMERYPYFCVFRQADGEQIRLQWNEAPVPVFPDERCVVLGSEETDGHLLAFGCGQRKIILHASHFIADGMGILPVLLTVLYLYVVEKYGSDGLRTKWLPLPGSPVQAEEYAYPFPETPVNPIDDGAKPAAPAYALDPDAFERQEQSLYAYHLRIPQSAMMEVANPSDGSPVSFLSVMLFRALCALDPALDQPVVAHVQHQYRAAIRAPQNHHSLVSYIPVALSPRLKGRSVEMQNTVVRGQVIIGSEPEQDLRAVDRLVSVFSKGAPMSLAEKQAAMRRYIDDSIRGKTFGISYVGKMDWCGMEPYVEDLHAYIGEPSTPNMLLMEVMTIGADFSINFMQSGRGKRYVDAFMEQLRAYGIPATLTGEEPYTLCPSTKCWTFT